MDSMMLLSIVVPVFNTERWLGKCLDSLLGANSNQYEIVVVDDASTDSSLALARQYEAKHACLRIVEMAFNSGLCAVRNSGIAHARGEHLMFVDSDDYLVPGAVDEILSTLQTDDADIIRFRLKRVSVSGETLVVQSRNAPGRFDIQTQALRTTSTLCEVFNTFCLNTMGGKCNFQAQPPAGARLRPQIRAFGRPRFRGRLFPSSQNVLRGPWRLVLLCAACHGSIEKLPR